MSNTPRTLFTADVAVRFGVTSESVSRWVKLGKLAPAGKGPGLRGTYIFDSEEVDRFAATRTDRSAAHN